MGEKENVKSRAPVVLHMTHPPGPKLECRRLLLEVLRPVRSFDEIQVDRRVDISQTERKRKECAKDTLGLSTTPS